MSSENVDDDRVIRLPEEIRSYILSLMPTKDVVQTSILSKRWRNSWTLVTFLDLCYISPDGLDASFTKFVDRALKLFKTTQLKLFRLHVKVGCPPKSTISNWCDEVARLNVCELDILVDLPDLPLSIFTCQTLTTLRLARSRSVHGFWECSCSVNLPCLKTLDIKVCSNPLGNVFKLISGCPVLETLSLQVSWQVGTEDYKFNIPTLKRLELKLAYGLPTSPISKVFLSVPNLEYFFFGGALCWDFVVEDMSSLVEASVLFANLRNDYLWIKLLKGINRVKSLSVANFHHFNDLRTSLLGSALPIFPHMKHLKLSWICPSAVISVFLEFSLELKHLCIEKEYEMIFQEPEDTSWIELKSVPLCMLTTLATIKFKCFLGQKCDIQLMEYILGNAEVLKKVTIIWGSSSIDEQMQLRAQLLKVPRASQFCEICFLGSTI